MLLLGGRPLPFVAGAVSDDARLRGPVGALLQDYDRPLSDLIGGIAAVLARRAPRRSQLRGQAT